jgi:flagellar basal body-associated protein FliL
MKKKNILIIVLCVVIVGLLSVIGVLVYKNVQEKKKTTNRGI